MARQKEVERDSSKLEAVFKTGPLEGSTGEHQRRREGRKETGWGKSAQLGITAEDQLR